MVDLPLFPLQTVLFPGATLPLQVFEPRYLTMIQRCLDEGIPFGVVLIRSGQEVGGPAVPFEVGTTARISTVQRAPGGRLHVLALGVQRFRILETSQREPYLTGIVEFLEDEDADAPETVEAAQRVSELFRQYTHLMLAVNGEWTRTIALPSRPGALADHVAARLELENRTKQRLLEELSVLRRLAVEQRLLTGALETLTHQLVGVRRLKYETMGVWN